MPTEAGLLAIGFAAFFFGGAVKGTLSIGLPMLAVPVLSLFIPPVQAIVLLAIPVLLSNLWQAWDAGDVPRHLRRFALLLACMVATSVLVVPLTLTLSPRALNASVAVIVLIAVLLLALPLKLQVAPAQERWWNIGVGAVAGVMGALSSLTGPVTISYLVALRLPRESFVGAISVVNVLAGLPVYVALAWNGRMGMTEVLLSTAGLVPMALGLWLGRSVRHRISEQGFRRALLGFLCVVAVALFFK